MRHSDSALSLDELARDPARAVQLQPRERARVQLQCAAILAGLAQLPLAQEDEVLLEPIEVARRLHVGKSTVYEMLRDGRLPYVKNGRRGRLVAESELRELIMRQTRRASQATLDAVRAQVRSVDGKPS
jgi:excisionase family DNA binding protein